MNTKGLNEIVSVVSGKEFSPRAISESTAKRAPQAAAMSSQGPIYLGFDRGAYPGDAAMINGWQ